jgi:hypothetical protein
MKIDGTQVHASVTAERVVEACEREMTSLDNPGICIACGQDADGCEPDARKYQCESCVERAIYGAQDLAMMMM